MSRHSIAIKWKHGPVQGAVKISPGQLHDAQIVTGQGQFADSQFAITSDGPCRMDVTLEDINVGLNPGGTLVTIEEIAQPFTFFASDVQSQFPIIIPTHGVAITPVEDDRTYDQIEQERVGRGLRSVLQQVEQEPEETFEQAAAATRTQHSPIWLGLSRDVRIFVVDYLQADGFWGSIKPKYPVDDAYTLAQLDGKPPEYFFMVGRGTACTVDIERHLEDGSLPILHSTMMDGDVQYELCAFASLEHSPLTSQTLRGTHFLVAESCTGGFTHTDEQRKRCDSLRCEELENSEDQPILCVRVEAVNTGPVPRYAWFQPPIPNKSSQSPNTSDQLACYAAGDGLGVFNTGDVFCCARLNNQPVAQAEICILIEPGDRATFEFFLPHRPISHERGQQLAETDFDQRHLQCKQFWQKKLDSAAQIRLPEKRIEQMIRAGLLHLDLITFGREPDDTLAATIGQYCPIGSESAPIIQFFDCMGWHDIARRSLMYFLDKQHDDGNMHNYLKYTIEPGAVLWCMGEHYRYTRDDNWIAQIAPKIIKTCDYIVDWRRRNQIESLRGQGYGMLDGQVGDPDEVTHYFMNSGYGYLGLTRASEMLAQIDPEKSKALAEEAAAFKDDIRTALFESIAKSPVVSLRDGSWSPTSSPNAEHPGPLCLLTRRNSILTHANFTTQDALLGPIGLVFQEIIEADESVTDLLLAYHHDLFATRHVAPVQPYYCRGDYAHLKRREIKSFLKAYYNGVASLADPQIYTFWEHHFATGEHKTEEEAWFLMQTRWMLLVEEDQTLRLLSAIPRVWLEDKKVIELKNMASYFGPISLSVKSKLQQGVITADITCHSNRQPTCVDIRLPHPQGKQPRSVTGGVYGSHLETVHVSPFSQSAEVILHF